MECELEIVFKFVLSALTVVGIFTLLLAKIIKGKRAPQAETDETRLVQEMYAGLSRLENRVNSLETIILDKERNNEMPPPL